MSDTKISALAAASTVAAANEFAINEAGASKKVTAAQILTYVQAAPPGGHFGSGKDGPATISAPTSLTKDMYYTRLDINAGIVLDAAGFRVFASDGVYFGDAASGIDHTPAVTANGGDASSSAAGAAGVVGAVAAAGNMTAGALGIIGKIGKRITSAVTSAGTAGGTSVKSTYGFPSQAACPAGGNGVTTTGTGAGGAAGAATTSDDTSAAGASRAWRNYPDCLWPMMTVAIGARTAIAAVSLTGNAASGGSGGCSGTAGLTSAASGGSGASGCSGGPTVVCARIISGAGYIRSSGAKGGNAGAGYIAVGTGTVAAGGSTGGNGGSGGLCIVVYGLLTGGCTVAQFTAPGGVGGTHSVGLSSGAGASATDGSDGVTGNAGIAAIFQMT